ncbi:MAG TPA: PAS domain S-box protein [bacterium]|nr:PAS domain S-box protein [bacterium]
MRGINLFRGKYGKTGMAEALRAVFKGTDSFVLKYGDIPEGFLSGIYGIAALKRGKQTAGAVIFKHDAKAIERITMNTADIGETGEIVIAVKDGNGVLLAVPAKNEPTPAFSRNIPLDSGLALPLQKAFDSGDGSGIETDYRGKKVLAAWKYLEGLGWAIVVKKDRDEVLDAINRLRKSVVPLSVVFAFFLIVFSAYAALKASSPVLNLASAFRSLASGDYRTGVSINTGDEMGVVGEEFNRMVKILAENAARVDLLNERLEGEAHRANRYLEVSEAVVVELDATGAVREINPRALKLLGYEKEEIIGKNWFDLIIGKKESNVVKRVFEEMINGRAGDFEYFENNIMTKGGARIPVYWHNIVLKDEAGAVKGTLSSGIDISAIKEAEKELEESEKKFRNLVENIPGVFYRCALDKEWTMHYLDEKIGALAGYDYEEFLENGPRRFVEIIHPEDREKVERIVNEAVAKAEPYELEYRIVNRNGGIKWVFERGSAERDEEGRVKWLDGVIFDISEKKNYEEELNMLLAELKRSNAELEQFAYIASHDLQEPLRSIAGYLQLIERRHKGGLGEETDGYMDAALKSAERMKTLINNVLDFSRIERKPRIFEAVDLNEALDNALEGLSDMINRAGAVIERETLPCVKGDPGQIEVLFTNLIGNSIKFHSEKKPVIKISCSEAAEEYKISVKDNGIGIDPAYFDRIFVIFQRLHGRNEYPGTGIGLAICKKIAERHGGALKVESEQGKGSVFSFTIPKRRKK